MFELGHRPTASERDCPLPDGVRAFLIASERRVVAHCCRLLAQDAVPGEERRRLTRLASDAVAELQRLGAKPAANEKISGRILETIVVFPSSVYRKGCGAGCQIGSGD